MKIKKQKKIQRKITLILLLAAVVFIITNPESSFAFESVKLAIRELCLDIEGPLGALLLTTVGIGALATAAMGNTKAAASAFIVAIGCYATDSLVSFYFPAAADVCANGVGAAGATAGGGANTNPGGGGDGGNVGGGGGGFGNPGGGGDGGNLRFSGAQVQRALREVGASTAGPEQLAKQATREDAERAFVNSLEPTTDELDGF